MGCCGQKRELLKSPPAPIRTLAPATVARPQAPTGPVTPWRSGPVAPAPTPATPVGSGVPVSAAQGGAVALRYLERSPVLVQGPATGRQYRFSADNPVQPVDGRDAAALVRTRFFRVS